jgi:hypothetical protein
MAFDDFWVSAMLCASNMLWAAIRCGQQYVDVGEQCVLGGQEGLGEGYGWAEPVRSVV